MAWLVRGHDIPVTAIRPKRRHAPPARSAAEQRRERDVRIWDLARLGWSPADIHLLTGLSVRQVKRRLAAMAAFQEANRRAE
jgi:hypothetical protein